MTAETTSTEPTQDVNRVLLTGLAKAIRTTAGGLRARSILDASWQALATIYADAATAVEVPDSDDTAALLGFGVALAAVEALVDLADQAHVIEQILTH